MTSLAEQLGNSVDASVDAEAKRKAEKMAALHAVGPRRHSRRATTAQKTRALLAKQALRSQGEGDISEAEQEEYEDASQQSGSENEVPSSRKRARPGDSEEEDYDPLEEELSEDSKGHDDDSEAEEVPPAVEPAEHGKAAAQRATPARSKAGPSVPAAAAGTWPEHANLDSEEDEDLQQALAASLLDAQQGPGRSTAERSMPQAPTKPPAPASPSTRNSSSRSGAKQQPAAAQPSGRGRKAEKAPPAAAEGLATGAEPAGGKKGAQRRRRKPAPLEASETDLRKAFAMLAGSKSAIGAAGLQRVRLAAPLPARMHSVTSGPRSGYGHPSWTRDTAMHGSRVCAWLRQGSSMQLLGLTSTGDLTAWCWLADVEGGARGGAG